MSVSRKVLVLSKCDCSPWSVNGVSLEAQRLDFRLHLSLKEKSIHVDTSVSYATACTVSGMQLEEGNKNTLTLR